MYATPAETFRKHVELAENQGDYAMGQLLRELVVGVEEVAHELEDDTLVLESVTKWPSSQRGRCVYTAVLLSRSHSFLDSSDSNTCLICPSISRLFDTPLRNRLMHTRRPHR